jgi:hypothetical protein
MKTHGSYVVKLSRQGEMTPVVGSLCFYKNVSYGSYEVIAVNEKKEKVKLKTGGNEFWESWDKLMFKTVWSEYGNFILDPKSHEECLLGGRYPFVITNGMAFVDDNPQRAVALSNDLSQEYPPMSIHQVDTLKKNNIPHTVDSSLTENAINCKACGNLFIKEYKLTSGKCYECHKKTLPDGFFEDLFSNIETYKRISNVQK